MPKFRAQRMARPGATNARLWARISNPSQSVAFKNGVFVAADSFSGIAYHSADGIVWESSETSDTFLSVIVFYQNQFLALGSFGMITSTNRAIRTTRGYLAMPAL